MRIVSGSEQSMHVDRCWMEVALKSQGPDGVICTPARGRPWAIWQIDEGARTDLDQMISPWKTGGS